MILKSVCVLCFFGIVYSEDSTKRNESELMKSLMNNYNKDDPPRLDKTTDVRVGLYLVSISSINEQTMEYHVTGYLRQSWNDPRLSFNKRMTSQIRMPEGALDKIWVPDIFFRNEKTSSFHDMTVPNRLFKFSSDGDVWYVIKFSSVLSCSFRLQRFPLDTQECSLIIESFGYTMDVLTLSFIAHPVDVDRRVTLPQFTLVDIGSLDCSQNYTTGSYPCLDMRFTFRRDRGYSLIQVYMPSIIVVVLSWFSFWLNREKSTARILIGLLPFLILSSMASSVRASLPRVSYVTALDVWFAACNAFVFLSVSEYILVHVLVKMSTNSSVVERLKPPSVEQSQLEKGKSSEEHGTGGRRAHLLDWFSRICFPAAFILFNLIYWIGYNS